MLKKFIINLSIITIMIFVLAGCGGESNSESSSADTELARTNLKVNSVIATYGTMKRSVYLGTVIHMLWVK